MSRHRALHLLLDCLRSRREPIPRGSLPPYGMHPSNQHSRFILYAPDGRGWDIDGTLVRVTSYGSPSFRTKYVLEINIRKMSYLRINSPPVVPQLSINGNVPIDIEDFSFDPKHLQLIVTYYE